MERLTTNSKTTIRRAEHEDSQTMLGIINNTKCENSVLKKTLAQLQDNTYFVAEAENKIVGTVGFKVWSDGLIEIISLVVSPECRGQGVGTKLVLHSIEEIKRRNIFFKRDKTKYTKIFALTTTPQLFEKLNFKKAEITSFPDKIMCDCLKCPRNAGGPSSPLCNEVALSFDV